MGREGIEEGDVSSSLLVKDRSQIRGRDDASVGGDGQSKGSPATAVVVISTLVAVSGSYVFGSAVSTLG